MSRVMCTVLVVASGLFSACTSGTGKCPDGGLGDGGACGGGSDASASGGNAVKRIFVTSGSYGGDLKTAGNRATGLQGGDALCNQSANAALLGGTWVAWLSDGNTDAIDRVNDVGPWYLVDRTTRVFNNKANLTTTPLASINQDENGADVLPITPYVWTGTVNGGRAALDHCENWTASGIQGARGAFRGGGWTAQDTEGCVFGQRLYCLEQ